MHLDASQLEFLGRLGKSPEGQQLQALIKAEVEDVNEQLRKLSGESLIRAQGKAIYLDEFLTRLTMKLKPPRDLSRVIPRHSHDGFA